MGTVGDPYLTGSFPRPIGLPATGQPVSVCHQWSITGTFRMLSAHWIVSGSARSPARNRARNRGGAGNRRDDPVPGDPPPESARIGGAPRLAFKEDRGAAVQQRPVDDV